MNLPARIASGCGTAYVFGAMSGSVRTTDGGVVILDYADLRDGKDLIASIKQAYDFDGIGLLVVENVPKFAEYRSELLPLAHRFANFPEEVQNKSVCTVAEANYSYGWSWGKEILKPGKFDDFKGSYYNNPQYDVPTEDPEMIKEYPDVCLPNIWPNEDLPELEPAFKQLGQLIVDVGILLAKQCDAFVRAECEKHGTRFECPLEDIIKESRTCKARLLHYFKIDEDSTERTRDSWCGWHNDHGSLTGLCPAMFMKECAEVANPDATSGLYARTMSGKEMKISVPSRFIAYQIGECSQINSGGLLRATPHAVQAIKYPESVGVSRETFAVFMQPNFDSVLTPPKGREDHVATSRFSPEMTFGDFSKATTAMYYSGEFDFFARGYIRGQSTTMKNVPYLRY